MTFEESRMAAVDHLRREDRVLRAVIDRVGPCTLRLQRGRFAMLARAILFQQISGHAAKAIHGRLLERLPGGRITPEGLAALDDDSFRYAGVSAQKVRYLRSLAELTVDGKLRLQRLAGRSDQQIIDKLVQVKGIGVWTAQMFLMFSLGRPDVLPWDDLGVRQAIRKLYLLDSLPDRAAAEEIAKPWRPYATFASWYCWRSLEIQDPGM